MLNCRRFSRRLWVSCWWELTVLLGRAVWDCFENSQFLVYWDSDSHKEKISNFIIYSPSCQSKHRWSLHVNEIYSELASIALCQSYSVSKWELGVSKMARNDHEISQNSKIQEFWRQNICTWCLKKPSEACAYDVYMRTGMNTLENKKVLVKACTSTGVNLGLLDSQWLEKWRNFTLMF